MRLDHVARHAGRRRDRHYSDLFDDVPDGASYAAPIDGDGAAISSSDPVSVVRDALGMYTIGFAGVDVADNEGSDERPRRHRDRHPRQFRRALLNASNRSENEQEPGAETPGSFSPSDQRPLRPAGS